jgi:hypothetical protein
MGAGHARSVVGVGFHLLARLLGSCSIERFLSLGLGKTVVEEAAIC